MGQESEHSYSEAAVGVLRRQPRCSLGCVFIRSSTGKASTSKINQVGGRIRVPMAVGLRACFFANHGLEVTHMS